MAKLTQVEVENRVKLIFGDKIKVTGEYKGSKEKIEVETKFGKHMVKPSNLFSGQTPSVITALDKNDCFKRMYMDRYPNTKYILDKINYVGIYDRITVTCPIHGDFTIRPNNFYDHNQGCPICQGHEGSYTYGAMEANKEKYSETMANLYLIECWNDNEHFIKIGITTQKLDRRFCSIASMPYNYRILDIIHTDLYAGGLMERNLHNTLGNKYVPSIKFGGFSECYEYNENCLKLSIAK